MIVNVSTTNQNNVNISQQHTKNEELFSIEDTIGQRLLQRIIHGGARSRPEGIRRERRGYMPAQRDIRS